MYWRLRICTVQGRKGSHAYYGMILHWSVYAGGPAPHQEAQGRRMRTHWPPVGPSCSTVGSPPRSLCALCSSLTLTVCLSVAAASCSTGQEIPRCQTSPNPPSEQLCRWTTAALRGTGAWNVSAWGHRSGLDKFRIIESRSELSSLPSRHVG